VGSWPFFVFGRTNAALSAIEGQRKRAGLTGERQRDASTLAALQAEPRRRRGRRLHGVCAICKLVARMTPRRASDKARRSAGPSEDLSMAPSPHEHHVIRFLRGPVVARIRFKFPDGAVTMTVDRAMYSRVASAIEHGHIHVVPTNDAAKILPGAGAVYDGSPVNGGTIFIKAGKAWGRDLEGDLVHECTHAGFDVDKRDIFALTEEAVAYVAEVLYYRMSNAPLSYWAGMVGRVRDVALPVANGLLHEYQTGKTPIPAVDPVAFHALRGIIPLRPVYWGKAPGTGGKYNHNG
jgi:hypothetical protein